MLGLMLDFVVVRAVYMHMLFGHDVLPSIRAALLFVFCNLTHKQKRRTAVRL